MGERVLVLVGTRKGAFILESDAERRSWRQRGPFCATWPMNHVKADPRTRHDLWRRRQRVVRPGGLEIHRPGRDLDPFERGPRLRGGRDADPLGLEHRRLGRHGLCRGRAGGPVPQRRSRPDLAARRRSARAPLAGRMAAGRRWADPALAGHAPRRSAAALGRHLRRRRVPHERWRPDLGGQRNSGTRCDFLPEDQRYPEYGQCVHHLTMAPGRPDRLYQQNHCGMYRSEDGGRRWESIEAGLPSTFGFPGDRPSA